MPLDLFAPATREWFTSAFAAPTRVQVEGWRHIAAGEHTLLCAPTGSGKTLAAFLWCIDRLTRPDAFASGEGFRVLYISPLKALAYDVERNLRAPLVGIGLAAERLGTTLAPARVAVRTGDTPARDRRLLLRDPGDILVTTPESLYLMLGSAARETLRSVDTVIVDEIHALAPTKRGIHLALSLERLTAITARDPQRIGLSATQRPLDEVARYLGGDRPVAIVDASERPRLDLTIEVPVEDMERPDADRPAPVPPATPARKAKKRGSFELPAGTAPPAEHERGIWPSIHPRLLELVRAHHSTIVFTNSRRLCERLAQRLNELAGEDLVRAHHGSIARAQREAIEEMLKAGRLRGIVATSSLELGIDMGAVDLVVQIESPGSVSRGLQRIGRAGHQVGERSVGRIFPKFRGDLLEATVVAHRMLEGEVEPIRVPRNALDVLAQQLVATCADREWRVDELGALVRRAYSFRELSPELFTSVLDMLAGRYPSDEFADLRPRLVWDRARNTLTARRDARLLALVNGGTIPDRGLYGVYLGTEGPRVGELDEEMVHECRVGQTFLLGASTWRIQAITRDRVIVTAAPGEPGKMPFWRGEGPGRPAPLGRALGAFVRIAAAMAERSETRARAWLEKEHRLDERAAKNLVRYLVEQREATGTVPTDQAITIERFRDELGDWRVCILSPFGARVHAPWALALEARLGGGAGFEVQTLWSDDGIVLRFADAEELPGAATLVPDPEEVEELLLSELGRSALFATHFRENAARSLLLPRRRPGKRTPLWSQRIRAQNLLAVAARHPGFPILLETYRECLHDVFDLPALVELLGAIRRREVRVVETETRSASPFARSLAFAYVAAYLYEGDAPLAERKAQALTLDRNLLRELLGQEELRDLLEPEVMDEVEAELQSLAPDRHVRSADGVHDLLRRVGDLDARELGARTTADPTAWLAELGRSGRIVRLGLGGGKSERGVDAMEAERWVAVEDVARYRDGLGAQPPPGIPSVFLEAPSAPLEGLVARYARTHGPFTGEAMGRRFGLRAAQVEPALRSLAIQGRLVEGEFRSGGREREWCDVEVLRVLRRRTLARLRSEVAPVEAAVLARFLPRWQGVKPAAPAEAPLAASDRWKHPHQRGEEIMVRPHKKAAAPAAPDVPAAPASGPPVGPIPRRDATLRLREAVVQLEGLPLPFSELERAILPARIPDFQPRLLDELGALGELVWVGRGALGPGDGRIALYRRDRVPLLLDAPAPGELPSPLHRALLDHLESRGASFFLQIQAAAPEALQSELLEALWDLVWAGLVTNDTFQPLRALAAPGRRAGSPGPRLRPARLGFEAGGRWSAVAALRAGGGRPPSETEVAHARAHMLLERYGVVSREAVAAEGLPGGFAAVAPVLRAMEEAGKVRRGYFVEGMGGSQYALPGAVDRLRAARPTDDDAALGDVVTLSAVDPANPYGTLLPWPGDDGQGDAGAGEAIPTAHPRRVTGAKLVLVRGLPVFYLESGGRRLRFLVPTADAEITEAALLGLRHLAKLQRHHELRIEQIDGVPALRSDRAPLLRGAGFRVEPNRLVLEVTELNR